MSPGIDLLRMLEPAVRPTGVGAPSTPGAHSAAPIEQRGFDELLSEARAAAPTAETAKTSDVAPKQPSTVCATGPLGALGRIDAVENNALRSLLAQSRTTTDQSTPKTAS